MPRQGLQTVPGDAIEPWEHYPLIWKTEAAFWAWVRGGVRGAVWKRYPAKLDWKRDQMQPPPAGYTGRAKSMGACAYCGELFAASHLEVDHIHQAGSCNSWETMAQFIQNLLNCNDNWCLACKPCHKIKSHAERKGIDFDAAMAEKKAIALMKQGRQVVLDTLSKNGYNSSALKALRNDAQRRAALINIFTAQRGGGQ